MIYNIDIKNARMQATREAVEGGTIEILTADNTVLAVFDLTATAGSVTGDVWTVDVNPTEVLGVASGDATHAQIKDSFGNALITDLTIGSDITLSNTNIAVDQPVNYVSGAITHAVDPA